MSDQPEVTQCYFAALDALRHGTDPLDATARYLRPAGVLTFTERRIAVETAAAARRDHTSTEGGSL